ncbi:hypothetical protein [Streptomyces sp. NPDC006784]|uniref:hypothetical protein n=1 Tax=Streptomyces sp. NPDC006784 TaxID=3364764 RepID=UPI003698C21F
MTAGRAITSAQRLAARALGADLPEPERSPGQAADETLAEAAAKPQPTGWTRGDAQAVLAAARARRAARNQQ